MIIAVSGVSIMPGATQLARIVGASSSAALAVSAITPALAAEYGPSPRVGRMPVSEALLTIAPGAGLEQDRAGGPDAR